VLGAQIGGLAIGVATQSLLAWDLGPAGRGSYAICSIFGTIMPVAFSLALDRATQVKLATGELPLSSAVRLALMTSLAAGSAGAIATLCLVEALPRFLSKSDPGSFALAALLMPVSFLFTFQLRLQTAVREFGGYLATTLAQGISNVVLIGFFVGVLGLGSKGALVALLLSYGAGSWLGIVRLMKACVAEPRSSAGPPWSALRSYGTRAYPAMVGHMIDLNVGTLMLGVLGTRPEIGLFAAVSALVQRFLIVPQSLAEALLPRVAADPAGRPDIVTSASRMAFAVTLLAALAFLVVRRPVVTLLLSRDFLPALRLLWWMAAGMVIHASSTLLMPYFDGTGRPEVVSASIWVGLLVNVLTLILLYPVAGMDAAAIGFFASLLSRFAILYFAFWRFTGTPLHRVLIIDNLDLSVTREALGSSIRALRRLGG
jgi:O-antigen/teichoic acid export membrane protein